jgi:hypothetical protein
MNKLLVTLMLLATSANVSAQHVNLKFSSVDDVISTKTKITGSVFSGQNVAMGSYNLSILGEGVFSGFCVDPYQSASSVYTQYTKSSLDASDFNNNGATRFANVQKLFDNAYGTLTNAVQTAGFHLALWEIFHDNGSVTTGNIKGMQGTNQNMLSVANTFLSQLSGWSITDAYSIDFFKSSHKQDFIIAKLNPPSQVPVPAALPLLMTGLAGLGFMRRRRA